MTQALAERIETSLDAKVAPQVAELARLLARENGAASAVLFYGSNLRTGELEGVLDFYILCAGPRERGIWPRVSYHEREIDGQILRAKVATMNFATFSAAARGNSRDTTIWARFVQPSALIWAAGPEPRKAVVNAIKSAAETASRLAAVLGPETGTADDFWRALFRSTYRAELRVEKPGREDSILSANRDHFDGLLPLAWKSQGISFGWKGDSLSPRIPEREQRRILRWWNARRRLGKPLNVARLMKASTTFDGAARYAAWKVERHTGVPVEVTPWREKHPILSAPAVLWRVWRKR